MKKLILGVAIGVVLIIIVYKPNVITPVNLPSNVYITAAHLETPAGYKLIYKDDSRDTAYYIRDDLELATLDKSSVLIEGLLDCKIVSSSPGRFMVETSRPDLICNGLSGARVKTISGEEIGFVSQMKEGGLLECKTIQ